MSEQNESQTSKLGVAAQAATSAAVSLVTSAEKENAVDAGLVSDASNKPLASVSGTTGTRGGALSGAAAADVSATERRSAYKGADPLGSLVSEASGTGGAALNPAASVGAGKAPATGRRAAYKAADPKLSMVSNSTKSNAVAAGLVKKKTDSALATVGKSGSPSSAAIGAVKGDAAAEVAAAAADPLKKRIMSAGVAGLATAAEAGFSLNSDDSGVQALEDTRHGAGTGAKGALRATKKARKKLKVGHAARKGKDAARKAKGTSSLVSNNGKGKVGKIASRSAAKKAAQMQKVMQARRVAMVSKAAGATGVKAAMYKVAAAIMSAVAAALPILAVVLTIIAIIALVVVFISTIISVISGWFNWFNRSTSYAALDGNARQIAQFLNEKGLNNKQIAALLGTWSCESGLEPRRCQYGDWSAYDENGTVIATFSFHAGSDDSLADDYPEELISNGNFGYGLAQWTSPGRAQGLVDYAAEQNKHSGDMNVQLEYFWQEFTTGYYDVYYEFSNCDDIDECVTIFASKFEINQDTDGYASRKEAAHSFYDQMKSASGGGDVLQNAKSQLGSYYYWAAEGEVHNGHVTFDCSGFVKWCYDQAGKTGLEHYSVTIYNQCDLISEDEAQPGDIVGWGTGGDCYHVGIYAGDGQCIDACGPTNWTEVPSDYVTTYHDVHFYDGTLWFGRYNG